MIAAIKGDVVIMTGPSYQLVYGKILTFNYVQVRKEQPESKNFALSPRPFSKLPRAGRRKCFLR